MAANPTPPAIFWDMDGTMVDTEPLWGIATYELSEKLGRRITPTIRETTLGGTFANTLKVCAEYAGVSVTDAEAAVLREEMYRRMEGLLSENLEPHPGLRGLLGALRDEGVPMLVTTNTVRRLADISIAAVGEEFFSGSVAGDEVDSPKPAPDMYLKAAGIVGVEPGDCLVFEDSTSGMTAGAAAGCRVIGLPAAGQTPPAGVRVFGELFGAGGFSGLGVADVRAAYESFR